METMDQLAEKLGVEIYIWDRASTGARQYEFIRNDQIIGHAVGGRTALVWLQATAATR